MELEDHIAYFLDKEDFLSVSLGSGRRPEFDGPATELSGSETWTDSTLADPDRTKEYLKDNVKTLPLWIVMWLAQRGLETLDLRRMAKKRCYSADSLKTPENAKNDDPEDEAGEEWKKKR